MQQLDVMVFHVKAFSLYVQANLIKINFLRFHDVTQTIGILAENVNTG